MRSEEKHVVKSVAYRPGGVIHSYQKYDPNKFPPPNQPPPDLVSPAFEQALMYGDYQELSEEDLARAVHVVHPLALVLALPPSSLPHQQDHLPHTDYP